MGGVGGMCSVVGRVVVVGSVGEGGGVVQLDCVERWKSWKICCCRRFCCSGEHTEKQLGC